jgi:hypothetical protein
LGGREAPSEASHALDRSTGRCAPPLIIRDKGTGNQLGINFSTGTTDATTPGGRGR